MFVMLDEGYHELPLLAACVASGSGLCWPCSEELVLSVGTQEISAISVMRRCWQQVPALSPRPPRSRRAEGSCPRKCPVPAGCCPTGSSLLGARPGKHSTISEGQVSRQGLPLPGLGTLHLSKFLCDILIHDDWSINLFDNCCLDFFYSMA